MTLTDRIATSDTPRTSGLAHNIAHKDYEEQAEEFCDLACTLERELAAETLKRRQISHERDCILEDLAVSRARELRLREERKRLRECLQRVVTHADDDHDGMTRQSSHAS